MRKFCCNVKPIRAEENYINSRIVELSHPNPSILRDLEKQELAELQIKLDNIYIKVRAHLLGQGKNGWWTKTLFFIQKCNAVTNLIDRLKINNITMDDPDHIALNLYSFKLYQASGGSILNNLR